MDFPFSVVGTTSSIVDIVAVQWWVVGGDGDGMDVGMEGSRKHKSWLIWIYPSQQDQNDDLGNIRKLACKSIPNKEIGLSACGASVGVGGMQGRWDGQKVRARGLSRLSSDGWI